jgi:hypothetical protein
MRKTERLRRLARRLRVEELRLIKIAEEMQLAKYPMCGRDVRRYAAGCGLLALSLDHHASTTRDRRGSPSPQEEKL